MNKFSGACRYIVFHLVKKQLLSAISYVLRRSTGIQNNTTTLTTSNFCLICTLVSYKVLG